MFDSTPITSAQRRGAGKTRAGAEWVRLKVEGGVYCRLNLVGRTEAFVPDTIGNDLRGV